MRSAADFTTSPPTGDDGLRPKAVALGTKDFLEAINLSYPERERFQLVAEAVKGRMFEAIEQYLKTSYNTGKAQPQICTEMGNPLVSEITETKVEDWAKSLRARKCRVAIRSKEAAGAIRERKNRGARFRLGSLHVGSLNHKVQTNCNP